MPDNDLAKRFASLHGALLWSTPLMIVLAIILFLLARWFPESLVILLFLALVYHMVRTALSRALVGVGDRSFSKKDHSPVSLIPHQWLWDTRSQPQILTFLAENHPRYLQARITIEVRSGTSMWRKSPSPQLAQFLLELAQVPSLPQQALESLQTARISLAAPPDTSNQS